MIRINGGNILNEKAEALVNTVNTVGFMGKGIALQFKQAYPENFAEYSKACRANKVKLGQMFVFDTGNMFNPKYIINFPTKKHWRGKSKLEDLKSGLKALLNEVKILNIKSIAIPPLGCGLGGLDWKDVRPLIENAFADLKNVEVHLFEPKATPEAKAMIIRTRQPKMTIARALFIKLMEQYILLATKLSLLEIHKLAYFLQEAGEPLRLRYKKAHFGPYAENLNKVLETIEGHFIRGYGDNQRPDAEIILIPNAIKKADDYLKNKIDSKKRLVEVAYVIKGFEYPYGVELLSSVHWVAKHYTPPAVDVKSAIEAILNWSDRKRRSFQPEHIQIAWETLHEKGWINKINNPD